PSVGAFHLHRPIPKQLAGGAGCHHRPGLRLLPRSFGHVALAAQVHSPTPTGHGLRGYLLDAEPGGALGRSLPHWLDPGPLLHHWYPGGGWVEQPRVQLHLTNGCLHGAGGAGCDLRSPAEDGGQEDGLRPGTTLPKTIGIVASTQPELPAVAISPGRYAETRSKRGDEPQPDGRRAGVRRGRDPAR